MGETQSKSAGNKEEGDFLPHNHNCAISHSHYEQCSLNINISISISRGIDPENKRDGGGRIPVVEEVFVQRIAYR